MRHSIIDNARNATGVVPKCYFRFGNTPFEELPVVNARPIDLTTLILPDENPSRQKYPFKFKGSFSIEVELHEEFPFKKYVSQYVADLCNFCLPYNTRSRCIKYDLIERLFEGRLWMSRYLANLNYNKKKYEEDIERMARNKISTLDRLYYSPILLEAYFR